MGAETMEFITDDKSHGSGSSIFTKPSADGLRVAGAEFDLESGRGYLK